MKKAETGLKSSPSLRFLCVFQTVSQSSKPFIAVIDFLKFSIQVLTICKFKFFRDFWDVLGLANARIQQNQNQFFDKKNSNMGYFSKRTQQIVAFLDLLKYSQIKDKYIARQNPIIKFQHKDASFDQIFTHLPMTQSADPSRKARKASNCPNCTLGASLYFPYTDRVCWCSSSWIYLQYGRIIVMSGTKVVHRFLRSPNISSDIYNRVANRFDPIANTQVSLSDPVSGRTLTLIGTTNSSTTLAHRTKALLEKERPDAVYVQASPVWWKYAQHLDLHTQPLFSRAAQDFPEAPYKFENHLRGILFRARYLTWRYFFESAMRFPDDFNFFRPGLETAYALKYAAQSKAQQVFGGVDFDPVTIEALRLQPDLYFYTFIWRALFTTFNTTSTWTSEYQDFNETVNVRGGEAFAESLDRSRINFFVGLFSKSAPKQKAILIDLRDERIFRELYALKAKHTVAVVNQWHMEGVETHWRRHTNTELPVANRSPIADMDIDAIQEKTLVNEYLREYTAGVTKSEPASWQDYSTGYHKENFEYERTRHTHHDSHEDVPAPGEKSHHSHH